MLFFQFGDFTLPIQKGSQDKRRRENTDKDKEQWTMDNGLWTIMDKDNSQWTMDYGQWTKTNST